MRIPTSRRSAIAGAILVVALVAASGAVAAPAFGKVTRIRLGSATDVSRPSWNGPAFTMNGDGGVVAATMTKAIDAIRGGTGSLDVTVIAASAPTSGSATPECDVIMGQAGVNSCTTLTLTQPADGDNTQVNTDIRNAEFVYFAGGNQCNYVAWKGKALEASVESVVAKGGGAGGGSAGTHINSAIVYDACNGSVTSSTALADPYDRTITFTADMFVWPNYADTINDSHFVTRDRMGRTMAFVARAIKDGLTTGGKAWGVGVEQGGGSLYIDKTGLATLTGSDAYIVLGDHQPERAVSGQPLTFSDYKIWRLQAGQTFDFAHRPTCGYYLRSVTNGVADANLYSGTPVTSCSSNTVTVTNPGDQSTLAGSPVSLQITATDSAAGQTLTYTSAGLPTGLSISSGTGLITGTPATAGTYQVTVTATDTTNASGTATFTWTVTASSASFTEAEPNDSRTTANTVTGLPSPFTITGSMSTSTDRDYFATSLASGQSITVDCAIPSAYDADLYFLSSTGSTLIRSVNDGAGADESITYTRTSSGSATYYIDLEAYSGSGAAMYTCTVTIQ